MNVDIDYYSALGILPSADSETISAVYRALAKKFHPDVYRGDQTIAERRMRELNEAYAVLSDEIRRKNYDDARKTKYGQSGSFSGASDAEAAESKAAELADWQLVKEYHPECEEARANLEKMSPALALAFQLELLRTKSFSSASAIRLKLKSEFLTRYFGANGYIREFAEGILKEGQLDAAKELNRVVKVLALDNSSDALALEAIRKIKNKFGVKFTPSWDFQPKRERHQEPVFPQSSNLTTRTVPKGDGSYFMGAIGTILVLAVAGIVVSSVVVGLASHVSLK